MNSVATSKLRPLAATTGAVAQEPCDGLQIQGRRHHHQAQILAQVLLTLDAQRQSQVGIQTAFVKLVEDHAADAGEGRIFLQHAGENPLGHHFDARLSAHARLEPRAKPDAAADRFPEQLRHASATARAAMRRGSSIKIFCPSSRGWIAGRAARWCFYPRLAEPPTAHCGGLRGLA